MKQHNYPHLPKYFAIKRDENNPLWNEYIQWLNKLSGDDYLEGTEEGAYYGFDGNVSMDGVFTDLNLTHRCNPPISIITIEQWKQAIDKTPSLDDVLDTVLPYNHPLKTQEMKDTDFKPGEFARFPNSEIPAMLDLLRENGHPVYESQGVYQPGQNIILCSTDGDLMGHWTKALSGEKKEISRSEFLHKATRGKENAPVEFDPSKPFEVSDDGVEWKRIKDPSYVMHYVGVSLSGKHVIEGDLGLVRWNYVRNVTEPFTAEMLEVGEYMETEAGPDGKKNLIKCISDSPWTYHDIWNPSGLFYSDIANNIKGRRVKVNITTEEY